MKALRFTINAYAVATCTLGLGIILSVRQGDWSWFSRSGSLVVINGIILTSRQILDHIQHLKQRQIRRESQFERDWAKEGKHHLIREDHEHLWKSEKYGLYMLISGTFIWGFGDLLNGL